MESPPTADDVVVEYHNDMINFIIKNMRAYVHADFSYSKLIFSANGKVSAYVPYAELKFGIYGVSKARESGRFAPNIEIREKNLYMNPDDVFFSISGDFGATILDLLKDFFKDDLVSAVCEATEDYAADLFAEAVNNVLDTFPLTQTIPETHIAVDYSITGTIDVSPWSYIGVQLVGQLFDIEYG